MEEPICDKCYENEGVCNHQDYGWVCQNCYDDIESEFTTDIYNELDDDDIIEYNDDLNDLIL